MSQPMEGAAAERPVRKRNIVGFGLGDIYGGGAFLIVGMLFMFYMTEVVHMKPVLAGLMFGLGKAFDGVADPLMGFLSDRTKSKAGRRRVYFLWGIVPIAVTFALIWVPIRSDSQALLFIYYFLAFILLNATLTMVMTPYSALPAEMSSDFKVRNRLSTSRLVFSGISSLIAAVVPKLMIDAFPGDPGKGHLAMGIAFGLLFALPWIIVYKSTWENNRHRAMVRGESFLREFATIFRNRSFRIHILIYIFAYTAMDVLMALFTYYLTYYIGRPGIYSITMGTLMVAQLAVMPLYGTLASKKGPGIPYAVGLIVWAVGMVALTFLIGPGSPLALIAAVSALIGMGTSAGVLIPYTILPFVIDVDELITGEQRSGVYAGAMTLLRKLVQGLLAMPAIGLMLQGIGFIPNAVQSHGTLSKFVVFFIGAPGLLIVCGILAATRFRITPKTHAVLKAELGRLRAGGARAEVDAESKRVCELLSGVAYAKCRLGPVD
jgi:oligogalacturonide transporter